MSRQVADTDNVCSRRMTPDEVLAVLREMVRSEFEFPADDVEYADVENLSMKMWVFLLNDLTLRPYAAAVQILSGLFELSLPEDQWRAILHPLRRRTVRDVAASLAEVVCVPVIPAPALLGRPCRTAGAFLLVRSLLAREGLCVDTLRPSSALASYSRAGLARILRQVCLIAPAVREKVRITSTGHDGLLLLLAAATFPATLILMGLAGRSTVLGPLVPVVGVATIIALWRRSLHAWDDEKVTVEFDGLATFRDLCGAIVGEHA